MKNVRGLGGGGGGSPLLPSVTDPPDAGSATSAAALALLLKSRAGHSEGQREETVRRTPFPTHGHPAAARTPLGSIEKLRV